MRTAIPYKCRMRIENLSSLRGWRRRGVAAMLGLFAAAALPPFYILPLLIPAFSGLFLLAVHAPTRRQAFFDGWWWGFGYFTAGLYWICISLWVEPEKFAWLTPFALFGLPSVLAIYIGLVTLALYWIGARGEGRGVNRFFSTLEPQRLILLFTALWVGSEYLRAHLFTGFPWNLIGYALTATDATLQLASVTGIYGLSWTVALIATTPVLFLCQNETKYALRANMYMAFLFLGVVMFGVIRLESHPTRNTDIRIRIVQANVAQSLKWEPERVLEGLKNHVRLTRLPGLDSTNLVIWPETAVPYYISGNSTLTHDLGAILPKGSLLITGGMREHEKDAWNSAFVINKEGEIIASYDKHHLVPFGEYIPLRSFLPVRLLAALGMGDFSSGSGPQTLTIAPYPALSPLICYEAIFPGEATDATGRAQWLLSLTDDAWFGKSTGLFQDMEMARTRSVEHGLPLIRAANTGISAAFDSYGRILGQLPLEKEGVLDMYLPQEEMHDAIFSSYPAGCLLFILTASMAFLCVCHHKKHTNL